MNSQEQLMEIAGLEAYLKEENDRWARGVLETCVGKQIELLEIAREASRMGQVQSDNWICI